MHSTYDPAKSNPRAPVQKKLNYTVSYGGGFGGFGYLVKDSVSIGHAVAHDMMVGVATVVGPHYPQGKSDGIMGLGFKSTYYSMSHVSNTRNSLLTMEQIQYSATEPFRNLSPLSWRFSSHKVVYTFQFSPRISTLQQRVYPHRSSLERLTDSSTAANCPLLRSKVLTATGPWIT